MIGAPASIVGNGLKWEIVTYSEDTAGGAVTIGLPGSINSVNYINDYSTAAVTLKNSTTTYNVGTNMVADDQTVFFIYNSDSRCV